ncbi:MAG: holo-ACP synthase [Culicoidibacterales bacterium]
MIRGIGIDIIDIERISPINIKLAKKVLTSNEYSALEKIENRNRKIEFLGGRIAAKEAFVKALGTGFLGISFTDIEITKNELGAPIINCDKIMDVNCQLSITHSSLSVVAVVIIESEIRRNKK